MAKEAKKENLLTSWKAIAAYLDCDDRTCLRWEKKYGLPVHRIDGESRATVFAYKDELDRWLAKFDENKSFLQEYSTRKWDGKHTFYFLVTFILILAVRFFLLPRITNSPHPADFRVEKSQLVVLDEKGKELWSFDPGIENLVEEREYREHFQYSRRLGLMVYLPYLIMKDINQDGKLEVLFSIQTKDEFNEGKLLCFSQQGRLLWEFVTGRELKFGKNVYSPDYRIKGFEVCDLDSEGRLEIIVISKHRHFFPTQLVVLNCEGENIGEYWNCGRFSDFMCVDLDEDGKKEILAVGCNNEYNKSCLVVFDSRLIQGMSPQSGDFDCPEIGPGSEKNYILFPPTDVGSLETVRETIARIEVLNNRRLMLRTTPSDIFFEFNYNLELVNICFSDTFHLKHRHAVKEYKIDSELNEEYKENLARGILYYNGKTWLAHHTK